MPGRDPAPHTLGADELGVPPQSPMAVEREAPSKCRRGNHFL